MFLSSLLTFASSLETASMLTRHTLEPQIFETVLESTRNLKGSQMERKLVASSPKSAPSNALDPTRSKARI